MILMPEDLVMDEGEIKSALGDIATEILEKNRDRKNLTLIGIYTAGTYLAHRIVAEIQSQKKGDISVYGIGVVSRCGDVEMDLKGARNMGEPDSEFDGTDIILVKDVLYTGGIVGGALETIKPYGEPASLQLAVLVDQGHGEIPRKMPEEISTAHTYIGKKIEYIENKVVSVRLNEMPGVNADKVILM